MPDNSVDLMELPSSGINILETLQAGLAHHQASRLSEAEAAYRAVLACESAHPSALYLLGVLTLADGRATEAERLLAAALAVRPDHPETCFAYANALHRVGKRGEAIARYRALLTVAPDHVGAHVNLANCLQETGETESALAESEIACRLCPGSTHAETTRGAALLALGRVEEAIGAYQAALGSDPRHAVAHAGHAAALLHAERPADALTEADAALLCAPDLTEAEFVRAMALSRLGVAPAAIAGLERTIARDPTHAKAHLNLGNLLADEDGMADAEQLCRRAIALDPDLVEAYASLGYLLTAQGRFAEAIEACEAALERDPGFAQAEWNQGIALLLLGDYEKGWEKYEARGRSARFASRYAEPQGAVWRGESLDERSILVYAEQGLGDTIQFARYLPLLAARRARVILACDSSLHPLFSGQLGLADIVPIGQSLPGHDFWVNQMSLPRLFATRLDSIPSPEGYLAADPRRVARWHQRLPAGSRVGIVWAGNPRHSNDARRSIPVEYLPRLLIDAEASFVSMQVGPRAEQAAELPGIIDPSPELTDFAETAALIEALDLVIAVDTSTAHCAAALGKETWIMLPHAGDWRWLVAREDSPWYSSVRLFRQPEPGAWSAVLERVRDALAQRFRDLT